MWKLGLETGCELLLNKETDWGRLMRGQFNCSVVVDAAGRGTRFQRRLYIRQQNIKNKRTDDGAK